MDWEITEVSPQFFILFFWEEIKVSTRVVPDLGKPITKIGFRIVILFNSFFFLLYFNPLENFFGILLIQ